MPRHATPTLLLTRPLPDSRRFAALLPEMTMVISPVLRILPVAHDAARLAAAEALVFTSGHAVTAAGPGRGRTAFCVGPRSSGLARIAGFRVVEGPGDAAGLEPLILASGLRPLHPHGRHIARPLPVEGMVVYDQQALPLDGAARRLLARAGPVVLPLFSPRSARLLSAETSGAVAPLWLAAISDAALAEWSGSTTRQAVAEAPNAASLAEAIRRLCREEQS